jgi:hypothetical protein
MSTGEVKYAWVAAVVLVMALSAAAQNSSNPDSKLPPAPGLGIGVQPSSATLQNPQPAAVERGEVSSYSPLSGHQKLHIFVQQTYSAYTFANTAFDAGWAQMTDDWPAYGQGAEGYGKRYGALLANHEAGTFFEDFLFPTLLHQDPRYFRMGTGHSLFARVPYAASRVLVTHADDGHNTFNASLLVGMLFVDGLTNAYYPRPQRGFGDTMSRFGGGVLSSAETNLLREFWPDMARIFHKHEPDKLKKLEQLEKKMPLSDKLSPPDSGTVQPPAEGQDKGKGTVAGPSAPVHATSGPPSSNQ